MEKGLIVIGAGGHALVCIEVLQSIGVDIAGCLSKDGSASSDLGRLGVSVVGVVDDLPALVADGHRSWFIAVGDNRDRMALARRVHDSGAALATAISPRSTVSDTADLGAGALVMPGAVVNTHCRIGQGAIINTGSVVDHECTIGEFVHIAPGVALAGGVSVGEGALVGVGACVTMGRQVGAWAVVGAGAAVVDDVPDDSTVVGVPARPIRRS